jgi:hypothetical protein
VSAGGHYLTVTAYAAELASLLGMPSATDAGDVAGEIVRLRARVADLEARTEWGAEWADGGYCPAVPRLNEVFARAHARKYGTRVIRRYVGPWMLDESGEPTNLGGWAAPAAQVADVDRGADTAAEVPA